MKAIAIAVALWPLALQALQAQQQAAPGPTLKLAPASCGGNVRNRRR